MNYSGKMQTAHALRILQIRKRIRITFHIKTGQHAISAAVQVLSSIILQSRPRCISVFNCAVLSTPNSFIACSRMCCGHKMSVHRSYMRIITAVKYYWNATYNWIHCWKNALAVWGNGDMECKQAIMESLAGAWNLFSFATNGHLCWLIITSHQNRWKST